MDRPLRPGVNSRPELLYEIESRLSEPRFDGIPIGPVLNDVIVIDLLNGMGEWGLWRQWSDRIGRVRSLLRPFCNPAVACEPSPDRLLVTLSSANFRIKQLIFPVLEALGPERCAVLCRDPGLLGELPQGAEGIGWAGILDYDIAWWRAEYARCWPKWKPSLKSLCRQYALSEAVFARLARHLLLGTQHVAGCLAFLRRAKPAAIVTEYDRHALWSCLILAARVLKIPTFTLVHGVPSEDALGYVPVLADKVFCWGELDRAKFLAAGTSAERILLGGCPRLTRDLPIARADACAKLQFDPAKPVVMLATAPMAQTYTLADWFCAAADQSSAISAAVRLHPSERLETYAKLAQRHPRVRFFANAEVTLDESLAATDILVVSSSGIGSDALVKRRQLIVAEIPGCPLGHGRELIEQAGCPRVASAEELTQCLERMLGDPAELRQCHDRAEAYVARFCAAFGQESAARIAGIVQETVAAGKARA